MLRMELPTVTAPPSPAPTPAITAIETSVEATALEALMALQLVALPLLMLTQRAAVAIKVTLPLLMFPKVLPLMPLVVVLRVSHFASTEQQRRSNCERAQGAFQCVTFEVHAFILQ